MKKPISTLICAFLLSGFAQAQLSVAKTDFTPVLDGSYQEWPIENLNKEDKTGLSYQAIADEEFLYVLLVAEQMPFQQKIMRNGLVLNFSTKTGKKKINGKLLYPYNQEGEATLPQIRTEPGKRPDMEYIKELFLLRNKVLFVDGFADKYKSSQALVSSNGISLGVNWNEVKFLVFEYKIPLNQLITDNGSPTDPSNSIEMEVVVNGMSSVSGGMQGGGAAMGGGMRGGAGGRSGGAGRPGAGMGGSGDAARNGNQAIDMMNKASFKTILVFN